MSFIINGRNYYALLLSSEYELLYNNSRIRVALYLIANSELLYNIEAESGMLFPVLFKQKSLSASASEHSNVV